MMSFTLLTSNFTVFSKTYKSILKSSATTVSCGAGPRVSAYSGEENICSLTPGKSLVVGNESSQSCARYLAGPELRRSMSGGAPQEGAQDSNVASVAI